MFARAALTLLAAAQLSIPLGHPRQIEQPRAPIESAGPLWATACKDWDDYNKPAPPVRIHANTYLVGTCGISAILIVGTEGDILIDGGTEQGADLIADNIRALGFRVLAITLHDAVFDRAEVFADAARMGILLIPAAEVRLEGADVILLNVCASEIESLRSLDDLEELRRRRGPSLFTIAPHPFYVLGGSIGEKLIERIDCFDAIELCHFHKGLFDLNCPATLIARRFKSKSPLWK